MLCIVIAVVFSTLDYGWIVSAGLVLLATYLAYWSFKERKLPSNVVLSLGGVIWNEEDFCGKSAEKFLMSRPLSW